MMNRRIMIIGAGGIGSFLTQFLQRLGYRITVFDDDGVEKKNIGYQNFTVSDIGENKAGVLSDRIWDTSFRGTVNDEPFKVLTAKQLQGYNLVVCCADNLAVRRLLYQQGFGADAKLKWLDLRAQGRNALLLSYLADPSMKSLGEGAEGSFSCQAQSWDGIAKDIDCMNIVIAATAAQWIQKWFNDNNDVKDMMVLNI